MSSLSRLHGFTVAMVFSLSSWLGSGTASAASITYLSQTGSVIAQGATFTLGSSSDSKPVSTLADVDEVAFVEEGDPNAISGMPPGYYMARAEMQTTLAPTQLTFQGDAVADATWDGIGCCEDEYTQAGSSASVTIAFSLDADVVSLITRVRTPGRFDGPYLRLKNLGLGFEVDATDEGAGVIACGTLSPTECDLLLDLFYGGSGIILPAGDYLIRISATAHDPLGSTCGGGCGSEGGSVIFSIVPEPSTALLCGLGLAGLAARRRLQG